MLSPSSHHRGHHVGHLFAGLIAAISLGTAISYPDTRVTAAAALGACAIASFGLALQFASASPAAARIAGRVVIWIALIAPLSVLEIKTRQEVVASPITSWTLVRGTLPFVGFVFALILTKESIFPLARHEKVLTVFLGLALASTLWTETPVPTLLKALELTASFGLLGLLVRVQRRSGVDPLKELGTVIHFLLLTAVAGAVLVPGSAFAPISQYNPGLRLSGVLPYIHANLLGFLAAGAIVLISSGIVPRYLKARSVQAGLASIYLLVLLATRTRSSIVLLVVGIIILFLHGSKHRIRLLLAAPAVAALGIFVMSNFSDDVIGFVLRNQDQRTFVTFTGRTENWRLALDTWQEKPLTGYGFYSGHRLGPYADALNAEQELSNLDSLWVETLLNLGLLGFTSVAILVGAGTRRVLSGRVMSSVTNVRAYRALFAMSLVGSFVLPSLQRPGYMMIVFGIIILALRYPSELNSVDTATGPDAFARPARTESAEPE